MDKYGLPSEDRTKIIEQRRSDSKKWLNVPGIEGPVINPTHDQYLAAGWVLYIPPVIGENQYRGDVIITDTEWTYSVIDKDPGIIKAEKIQAADTALQTFIHNKAWEIGKYGDNGVPNINNCTRYVGYDNPYRAQSLALLAWGTACWVKALAILKEVEDGTRTEPTHEELIAELPEFIAP